MIDNLVKKCWHSSKWKFESGVSPNSPKTLFEWMNLKSIYFNEFTNLDCQMSDFFFKYLDLSLI